MVCLHHLCSISYLCKLTLRWSYMKILLINPPRSPENNILRYAPENARPFIHRKLIGPPLGLLTIAAAVKDFDVTVFDSKGEYDLDPSTPPLEILILQLLEKYRPDIVGVTIITSEFDYSLEIFRVVKQFNPSILTVAGGLHPTLCHLDFAGTDADIVIPGQCAHIFRDLVIAKDKRSKLESVPGIFLNKKGVMKKTQGKIPLRDAANSDYLMPDRRHLDRWISTYKVGNSPYPSTYVFSSLGCPYKCTFCSIWTQFKGKYYQRTIASMITELKSMDEYPVVRFADANTVVDQNFMS